MNDLTFFQIAMLFFQAASAMGIGGILVMVYRFGRWQGVVDQTLKENAIDHGEFRGDIRDVHTRVDGMLNRT
jgi:hypothetical protein